ncbi:MAG: hypothetical protein KBD63_01125 [Bacteriovoracaceae bacterium]|nr:hypothetical protein [Bacteriovoracaceae bacterium]
MKRIQRLTEKTRSYIQRPWYPILMGFLAAIDHFVIVIPTDGLIVTSAMVDHKRWWKFSLAITIGSTLGALVLAYFFNVYGSHFLEMIVPGIYQTKTWMMTDGWMDRYGIWAIFFVAALPIFQHPAIILGALAGIPLQEMGLAIFAGRALKYSLLGWLASHAPKVLGRFKSVQKEVEEVHWKGVHLPKKDSKS